ncbi:Hsp20/alpha crystallin family protein [Burkholderia sp. WSM2230]|uniref:Hsp20/alpha crystallin family protein n=1 Tax=Burkholderia sp. WSM2230 TaxID=944435 RepID=UPI0004162167|nr:Hsp20/alpha crystallin family protein [Burkholderia sp. WSM2230]
MSDLFASAALAGDMERLQRQFASLFGGFPTSIRAARFGAFPRINIGSTDDSIEIVAFAPGVDPAKLDVSIDKGLLTISGERELPQTQAAGDDTRIYAQERFAGSFRRAIELPQHADADKATARYVDGCLIVSVARRESSKPRAITVQ